MLKSIGTKIKLALFKTQLIHSHDVKLDKKT